MSRFTTEVADNASYDDTRVLEQYLISWPKKEKKKKKNNNNKDKKKNRELIARFRLKEKQTMRKYP